MLNVKNVNAGYGKFQALFDVSLEVAAGEAVAVIGPNGAGKSTLMRVISGMIPAMTGTIELEGRSVLDAPPHEIVGMGLAHVPEHRRLFHGLTVDENLRMGCFKPQFRARFEERREFVYELFPRMMERRDQVAGTMSGGEQEMCAIARALMSDPRSRDGSCPVIGCACRQSSVKYDIPSMRATISAIGAVTFAALIASVVMCLENW